MTNVDFDQIELSKSLAIEELADKHKLAIYKIYLTATY